MDFALPVIEGLRQIYTLQDAIRRQRYVNRKTYLQMMEFYVEVEPLQDNPTLQRTAAIQRLSDTVAKFSWYLLKYHDMNRVARIFKSASMKKQRQKVMDEVDELFRILNLAANVATMSGQAAASVNAARLLANHGNIRLTHDEIHAALVEEKQQSEMDTMKMPAERETFLGNTIADRVVKQNTIFRQPPLLRANVPSVDEVHARGLENNIPTP
ncbi:hypothetical protein PI124_g12542 [Phytophthora idaei]|nr:hypothetical protein PI124_g12542 [Phytophthora idaei]